jgi:hypothetical protein
LVLASAHLDILKLHRLIRFLKRVEESLRRPLNATANIFVHVSHLPSENLNGFHRHDGS